jgi:uncharacterized protein (TIGR02271 family)
VKNQGRDTVVGIFLDETYAQQAIQALQSAGFKANITDQSSLRSLNIPQNELGLYESRLGEGNTVVTVKTGDRGEDALGIMLQNGAEYMNLHAAQGSAGAQQGGRYDEEYYRKLQANQRQYGQVDQSTGRARTAEELRVQLREEGLVATKQAVQTGEVQVQKVVHERQEEIPVNLRREEVTIERHAVNQPIAAGEIGDLQDEVIRVPVYEEQAQLEKQARIKEEVVIGKQAVQEQQTLTGTTRHEHLEVNETGNVSVQGNVETDVRTSSEGMRAYDPDTQGHTHR